MKTLDLKPCPFCGGEAYVASLHGRHFVTCKHADGCGVRPDSWSMFDCSLKEQIKAWNRRVKDDNHNQSE